MACTRATVVAQAKSWIGKKESDGSHKEIIDVYNSHTPLARGYTVQYTDAWCAVFVSACAIKSNATDIIPTECSCDKMITLFKNLGCWQETDSYTPSVGDIIFYDWQDTTGTTSDNTGSADHVGIVESVSGTQITVIEGNKSDAVARRTVTVNQKYIRGYGLPNYTDAASTSSATSASSSSSTAASPSFAIGTTYTTQVDALNVRKGPGKSYDKVAYADLTANAKANAYSTGSLKKGTRVTCKAVKTITSGTYAGDIWIQIPSGWICAYYSGKVYVA